MIAARWERKGLIVSPGGGPSWNRTHAALPVVDSGDPTALYFTSRDAKGRSHIARTRLAFDPARALPVAGDPILRPGPLGAFDDAGVTSSCVVRAERRTFLFYTGWSLGVSVPFYLQSGLAVSDDGRQFTRVSAAPLLDRSPVDPYLNASPWVLIDDGTWRMWYVSGTGWVRRAAGSQHRYHIKYAESTDGLCWHRHGQVCLDYASPREYAFGRPCVIKDDGAYRMWFSVRGAHYRIGYAESKDGLSWIRDDAAGGLPPSRAGWDSKMTAYPCVMRRGEVLYMLYNGNDYGATGIGVAVSA